MKKMKKLGASFAAILMAAVMAFPSWADDYEKIDEVTLEIESEIYAGSSDSNVEVSTDTDGCYVDGVTITNEPDDGDEWEEGDKPKLSIVLYVDDEDEYRFASGISKSDISLDGADGEVTSVTRGSSGKKLTIKVTLEEIDYEDDDDYDDEDLDIEDIWWDDSDGVANWEENEYANRYEVRLYRDGSSITSVLKTTENEYDFSEYFTKKGDYTFKVRAVRSSSVTGSWYESDELSVDSDEAKEIRENGGSDSSTTSSSASEGAWLKDSVGWWWCNPDKTYPTSSWKYIDGCWYYFDSVGYCVMNTWVKTNEIWYYCGSTGAMFTNCWTPDGYWVNSDGAWVP